MPFVTSFWKLLHSFSIECPWLLPADVCVCHPVPFSAAWKPALGIGPFVSIRPFLGGALLVGKASTMQRTRPSGSWGLSPCTWETCVHLAVSGWVSESSRSWPQLSDASGPTVLARVCPCGLGKTVAGHMCIPGRCVFPLCAAWTLGLREAVCTSERFRARRETRVLVRKR